MQTRDDLAIGIDFGGTKMLGMAVDRSGTALAEHRVPTPYDGDELLGAMSEVVRVLEDKVGGRVVGVGVGAAGLVSLDGEYCFGPNVGHLAHLQMLDGMQKRLPGRLIVIDNDATCATWAERLLGAGRNVDEMALVTLGTGIGGGLISGGKLARGTNGFAGEPGHTAVEARGVRCICGKIGCWEAYASGRALGRFGREAAAAGRGHTLLNLAGAIDDIRGEHVTQAARMGDAGAKAVMDEFAWWVAVGVANLITLLDPQVIVVGGGLAEEADLFLDKTNEHLSTMVLGAAHRPRVDVVAATLGERSGAIGAAMMVHGELPED